MAVVSKLTTFTTDKVLLFSDSANYGYAVNKVITGIPQCVFYKAQPFPKKEIKQTVYFKRSSNKNEPYIPTKNRNPLPYEVDTRVTTNPGVILRDLFVESAGDGDCPGSSPSVPVLVSGGSNPAGVPSSYLEPSQSTKNAAIAKMHDKIEDQKTIHANYAVFAGEFSKSLSMIAQNATDIMKTYRALRKGKFSEAYSTLFGRKRRETFDPLHQKWRFSGRKTKRTADALWLEWTYGWAPLVSESFDIIDDLRGRKANFLVRATGRAHETDAGSYKSSTTASIGITSHAFPVEGTYRRHVDLRYTCWFKLTDQYWSDLSASGITDPLSVAWELVPFSFVADWFVNVGDYLRAQTIGRGWTFQYGCESKRQSLHITSDGTGGPFEAEKKGYERWRGSYQPVFAKSWDRFTRTVLTAPPSMTLNINAKIHSLNRIISSAALLKQLSKRK